VAHGHLEVPELLKVLLDSPENLVGLELLVDQVLLKEILVCLDTPAVLGGLVDRLHLVPHLFPGHPESLEVPELLMVLLELLVLHLPLRSLASPDTPDTPEGLVLLGVLVYQKNQEYLVLRYLVLLEVLVRQLLLEVQNLGVLVYQ
jgi:hypothetical protein